MKPTPAWAIAITLKGKQYLTPAFTRPTRRQSVEAAESEYGQTWGDLRKQGFRAIRVTIHIEEDKP